MRLRKRGIFEISSDLEGPKTRETQHRENIGKMQRSSTKSDSKSTRGRVSERFIEPVLKTGVPSAQPTPAEGIGETSKDDLGAFLGAGARYAQDLTELTELLAAWASLPDAMKAGIAAMVEAASGTKGPG